MLRVIRKNNGEIQDICQRPIVNYTKRLSRKYRYYSVVPFQYSTVDTYIYLQVCEAVFSEMYCLLLSSRSRRKPVREFPPDRDDCGYVSDDDGNAARKGNERTHLPFLSVSGCMRLIWQKFWV